MFPGMAADATLASRANVSTVSASMTLLGSPTAQSTSQTSIAISGVADRREHRQRHEPAPIAAHQLQQHVLDVEDEPDDARAAKTVPVVEALDQAAQVVARSAPRDQDGAGQRNDRPDNQQREERVPRAAAARAA